MRVEVSRLTTQQIRTTAGACRGRLDRIALARASAFSVVLLNRLVTQVRLYNYKSDDPSPGHRRS